LNLKSTPKFTPKLTPNMTPKMTPNSTPKKIPDSTPLHVLSNPIKPICLGYFSEILFVEEYIICASSYIFVFKDSSFLACCKTWSGVW
jgi:hypothetical protein